MSPSLPFSARSLPSLAHRRRASSPPEALAALTALISNRDEALQNLLKGLRCGRQPARDGPLQKALKSRGSCLTSTARRGGARLVIKILTTLPSMPKKSGWAEFTSGFIEFRRQLQPAKPAGRAETLKAMQPAQSDALERLGRGLGRSASWRLPPPAIRTMSSAKRQSVQQLH